MEFCQDCLWLTVYHLCNDIVIVIMTRNFSDT